MVTSHTGMVGAIRRVFAEPLAARIDPDDAIAPAVHRILIRKKPLLRDVYESWYRALAAHIGTARPVVEIGGGAGHLSEFMPGLISSDVRFAPAADILFDAQQLPFADHSLGGLVMTNVLHHLPSASVFLRDAGRVIRPGGVMAMIEPWVSPWSSWVYRTLHHEPFDPSAASWDFATRGPMSGANGALPWILFHRDAARFESEFPNWSIETVRPGWPIEYLLSGGVSMRSLPEFCRRPIHWLERRLERRADRYAMFALIVLRRRD
jgi:SAM-dependent methyltransferase